MRFRNLPQFLLSTVDFLKIQDSSLEAIQILRSAKFSIFGSAMASHSPKGIYTGFSFVKQDVVTKSLKPSSITKFLNDP